MTSAVGGGRVMAELLRLPDNGDATSQESIRKGWDKMKRERRELIEKKGGVIFSTTTYRKVKMTFFHVL